MGLIGWLKCRFLGSPSVPARTGAVRQTQEPLILFGRGRLLGCLRLFLRR